MSDTSLVFNLVARDQASGEMAQMKDKMGAAAGAIGLAVGAGLTAGMVKSLDVEAASDKLTAQLGLGPAEAAEVAKVSAGVYKDAWGESADQVNQAVRGVYQNIGDTSGAKGGLEGVTKKALALAQTFEVDLGTATRAAGQLMRTGLAADADEAFDIITRGMQMPGVEAEELLATLNEYPTQFRDMGLSGDEAMGMIAQAMKGGARDTDVAADAMKELNIRVKDGSAAAALGRLGLNADQMADAFAQGGPKARQALQDITDKLRGVKDPADRARLAQQLLGTQSEDLSKALYSINPDKAVSSLGKVEGSANKMAKTIGDNPKHALEKFKRDVETKLTEVGGKLLTWAQENQGWLKPLVIGLAAFAAIIAIVKGALMAYNAVMLIIRAATVIWTGIQWLLNAAMTANPIGLVVLAIIALIAIFAIAWMKSETFRAVVTAAWQYIWNKVKAVGAWFKNTLWPWIRDVWNKIASGAGAMWTKVKGWWNKLVSFVTGIPGRISRAASGMWNGIKSSFRSAVNWIIGKWNGLSLTIGGGSILGKSIPSVTLRTPNIPYLAEGGNIMRGGTAVVGEAGPELLSMPRGAQVTPLTGGRGGGGPVHVVFDVTGADEDMKRLIRRMVRTGGHGNVQAAFG